MSGRNLRVNLVANTSQFKSAMSETSSQMKLINSEFKNASAETDEYGNKLDNTGAKKTQLNGIISQYQTRIKAITNEQKHWTAELEKGNITEEQHAQKQEELARRLNNTEAEMKKYEGQLKQLNNEGKNVRMTYEEFDKQFRDVGKTMAKTGAQVAAVSGVAFAGLSKVIKDVTSTAMDFEAGMSEVEAISGATAEEMSGLENQAKELGRTTRFSAMEVSDGMSYLARAGFETNEVMNAMPGLLDLAASSNMNLGRAADITSNIISGFGYEAEEAGRVSDVLAKGASTANTDVEQLGGAMATVAPIASTLGVEFEDVAAATGLMSDSGIQGSQAGRMLRQGLTRLSKPTGEAADLIKELRINVFDANGNMKDLDDVLGELEGGFDGMSSQAETAALTTLFGAESTAGWSALLEEGSSTLGDYTGELENSEGAAEDMAETMQDNLQGKITELKSAFEGLKIELGQQLIPMFSDGVDMLTDFTSGLAEMDEETVEAISKTALLAAGVLGVTTAVATLVAGIGALMAFAGPVGAAIVAGTTLLGAMGVATYGVQQHSENLRAEQEEAERQARRYGDGVREGTREATKGYVDLYEGAKVEMLKLKTMSGEEAEETKANVVAAFSEMGDMVVAELEEFQEDFGRVVREIYGVYEEEGKKRADEIERDTREHTEELINNYEEASERISNIVEEHGADVSQYPEEVRKSYETNLAIMQEGVGVFAVNYEDALRVRNTIANNSDKILFEEAEQYAKDIEETHSGALESINEQYQDQMETIEQFKILYPENAEVYDEMMQTLSTSTAQEIAKIDATRAESTRLLVENTDESGRLIDFQTGKAMERLETEEFVTRGIGGTYETRTESDEDYYKRYLRVNGDYLAALEDSTNQTIDFIEQGAYDWAISMGKTEEEAKAFAKDIKEGTLEEINGIDEAGEIGEQTGGAYNDGLQSQETTVLNSAENMSTGVEVMLGATSDGDGGYKAGTDLRSGIDSTSGAVSTSTSSLSSIVERLLGNTSDSGGGRSAGLDLRSGLLSTQNMVRTAGSSVASSGERGLRSVSTAGAGSSFVAGFRNNINDNNGTIWNRAWNLGRTALGALRSSISTASPSKETEKTGFDFIAGFANSIDAGRKETAERASLVGKDTLHALNQEVEGFKQSFGAIALAVGENKQTLKVEHTLDKKFDEFASLFRVNKNNNENHTRELLDATLQQNQLLIQLLEKDIDVYLDGEPIKNNVNERNALDDLGNYF